MLIEGKNRINFEDIIGESEKIIEAKKLAKSVAKSDSAVLLRGESGTGKIYLLGQFTIVVIEKMLHL